MIRRSAAQRGAVAGKPSTGVFGPVVGATLQVQTCVDARVDRRNLTDAAKSASGDAYLGPLYTANRAAAVQIESNGSQEESPLTHDLREFIDLVIVPIMVSQFLSEQPPSDQVAPGCGGVAEFPRTKRHGGI
jgi:hypothetical protein